MEQNQLWEQILLANSLGLPVFIIGDFNCIISAEDKKGGRSFKMDRVVREFHDFFRQTRFVDLGFQGLAYTWCDN